jgi:endonuclease/exonuclease/phosphatase family metal-dependent hydrolase
MTYNILYGAGVNRQWDSKIRFQNKDRSQELISFIKEMKPDILGIQEAAGWDTGAPPFIQQFADDLEMDYYLAKAALGELHIAILSKYKIVEAENLSPEVGNVGALRAKLTAPDGQDINVFVIHLDPFGSKLRACAINMLIKYMHPYLHKRLIILGDFNAYHDDPMLVGLSQINLERIAVGGGHGIDQIWVSLPTEWKKSNWFTSVDIPPISDHRPAGAELTIFPAPVYLPALTPPPLPTSSPLCVQ